MTDSKPLCQGHRSSYRTCKFPARYEVIPRSYGGKPLGDGKPVPMCGVHRNEHERARLRLEQSEARRVVDAKRRVQVSRATNIATMLTDAVSREFRVEGVSFRASYDGAELKIDVDDAEKLLRWLT